MPRSTSFRLPAELLARLEEEATRARQSTTALVASLLDEGLKTRRFPGVVYREGPTGRRAGLLGGPDVWEIVRALRQTPGRGQGRIRRLADERGLQELLIRLAVDFYAAFPDEIDERVEADEKAAAQVQELVAQRERLLAG